MRRRRLRRPSALKSCTLNRCYLREDEFRHGRSPKAVNTSIPATHYLQSLPSTPNWKDTNPKDAVGIAKVPMSTVPSQVLMEVGLAMMEGALKYGRHNYRISGVRSSVYYDAAMRHLMAFWECEDIDPDSGLPHLAKAMASLVVLRDSFITGNVVDDRPPATQSKGWISKLNAYAKALIDKYPNSVPAYTKDNERNATVQMDTSGQRDKGPADARVHGSQGYVRSPVKFNRGVLYTGPGYGGPSGEGK